MYSVIFPNQFMSTLPGQASPRLSRAVGSLAGQTIKLMNFTNYDVMVSVGAEQVDLIPAYQYLIMPNEPDLFLTIVLPESTNYIYPQSYIAAKTFDDVLSYEIGSLIHFMSVSPGDTVNVSGNMTITNTPNVFVNGGRLDVNISGSPTFQLAAGTSVNIGNTPSVILSGTPNVNITGTPTVNVGGTVSVALTAAGNSVNIANTPAITISGTPSMNVANTSIPVTNYAGGTLNIAGQVNIGNTPSVSISGTPNVAISGTPTVQLTASGNNVNIANTPAVSISGTPNMNVTNTSIPVTNYAGGSLTVAGQVNIGNTVNANITSGTVNATIQNASLNSNITNALLQTGFTAIGTPSTITLTNFANGASTIPNDLSIPTSMYDQFILRVSSTYSISGKGVTQKYKFSLSGFSLNAFGLITAYSAQDILLWNATNDVIGSSKPYSILTDGSPVLGDTIAFTITNTSGQTIPSDTITMQVYMRYAAPNNVQNRSSQPVPISSNYYGTGADGVFNPQGNMTIGNSSNLPAIYNYTSVTIPSGVSVNYANPAKYVLIYCTGDVTINGALFAPPGITNIGAPTTPLSINGKTVPNAGNGGAGGAGASGGAGGSGGVGNCYAAGAGGGGGGGLGSAAGQGGGTGYGAAPGGAGGSYNGATGSAGASSTTWNTGTLCIVAGGNIVVNGNIVGAGANGGAAGGGVYNSTVNASLGGGGGSCGPNQGGAGSYAAGSGTLYGGGGAGGSGGASVFLFAGGIVNIFGNVNVSGGAGGGGGSGSIAAGTAGTAGALTVWQLGGSGGGL